MANRIHTGIGKQTVKGRILRLFTAFARWFRSHIW